MEAQTKNPKYQVGQLVEFKDYQDLRNYVGRIKSIVHSDTDPLTEYSYILDEVNFGQRDDSRWNSGVKDGVHVIERSIIRPLEDISVNFLLKYGWMLSYNPNHPKDLYLKNKYPIAIHHDKVINQFWIYNVRNQTKLLDIINPLSNEKEYDDLISPILEELKTLK